MAKSIIDELMSELSEITLTNNEVKENPDFHHFIEKICCENKKRVNCNEHFLTPNLSYQLKRNLESNDDNVIYSTLCFIAALGRYEKSRAFISDFEIIRLMLSHLEGKNINILTQACRALGNACYDNRKTPSMIADEDGLEIIVSLLEQSTVADNPQSDNKFRRVIVGLVLNLVIDCQYLRLQMVKKGVVPLLTILLKIDIEKSNITALSNIIFLTLTSLGETSPADLIFTKEFCRIVVRVFTKCCGYEKCSVILNFLQDNELPDIVKLHFAQAGVTDIFMGYLENKPKTLTEDQSHKCEQMGRVLSNILSGDIAMEYLYRLDNSRMLHRFVKWLQRDDRDNIHIALLCIGNIARTDRHCLSIVKKDIHKHLFRIIEQNTDSSKILYAAICTLRNLCIPRENKVQLIKDGVFDTLLPLLELEIETPPVIYKLIAIIRQLVDREMEIAIKLGTDENVIKHLVRWSSLCLHPSISSECSRLLSWLVIVSRDRRVMSTILRGEGYPQIARMLGALHSLMQSEALNAMTVSASEALRELTSMNKASCELVSPVPEFNFEPVLLSCRLGERLIHLLEQHGTIMDEDVLEKVFTFLEVIVQFERVVAKLEEAGLKEIFHSVMLSRNDFLMYKERIESIEDSLKP